MSSVVGLSPRAMPLIDQPLDIWSAAKRGLLDEVKGFIATGVSVDSRTREDFTLLHEAAGAGHVEVVRWLLECGAKINARTRSQRPYPGSETPLYLAVAHGHRDVVGVLLSRGADPNLKSSDGTSPLAQAVERGDQALVTLLIDSGARVNPRGDFSPLHTAFCMKRFAIARYLLSHGARADERVLPYRGSLLMTAASGKWLPGVELMLELGCDVNQKDDEGGTALHAGVLGFACRQLTWEKTTWGEKCIREEPEEAIPVVKRLLEARADRTIRDKHGFTPLDYAKKIRAQPIIELLQQSGSPT